MKKKKIIIEFIVSSQMANSCLTLLHNVSEISVTIPNNLNQPTRITYMFIPSALQM